MTFAVWRLAAGIAALSLLIASPAFARVEQPSPLNRYVQARAAASAGAMEQASAGFAVALAAAPDNDAIAAQALAHGFAAGDWRLAERAARALERRGALPPEGRFLLVAEAFRERDWRAARQQVDLVERERLFAFTVPVMRAWLAFGSGDGDPLSFLDQEGRASAAYAAEHRTLLQLAGRRSGDVAALLEESGPRAMRLRIAAAAAMAGRGNRAGALALLEGDEPPVLAARALIEAGRTVPGAIDRAPAGIAELLVRLAVDLQEQELTSLATSLARLATRLAPDSSESWMVAAELFAHLDRHDTAVTLLESVPAADPFAAAARDQRIRMLVEAGEGARGLAEAEAIARRRDATIADLVLLGEVLIEQDRPAEAAQAFARVLERDLDGSGYPEWAIWLFLGGAHDQAGDWPQARTALQRAFALAPDQPLVLNYLGYSQLERRENMVEAEGLVREAHRLAPDNAAITDSLGWALFLKGERDEAITLLEQAVEGAPGDVEINEHLGDAYYTVGRRVEARFAWTAARVYAEGEDAARLAAKIEAGLTPQLAAR